MRIWVSDATSFSYIRKGNVCVYYDGERERYREKKRENEKDRGRETGSEK